MGYQAKNSQQTKQTSGNGGKQQPNGQQTFTMPNRPNANRNSIKSKFNFQGKGTVVQIFIVIALVGVIAAVGYFGYMNTRPYVEFVAMFLEEDSPNALAQMIAGLAARIPWIGEYLASSVSGLLGLGLWFLIQSVEILPMVVRQNRELIKTYIDDAMSADQFEIMEHDDPFLATLKQMYNIVPTRTLRKVRKFALFAYVVDLIICIWIYPPVDGGLSDFMLVLGTGQMDLVNGQNVVLVFFSLFIIEILLHVVFMLGDLWRRITNLKPAATSTRVV